LYWGVVEGVVAGVFPFFSFLAQEYRVKSKSILLMLCSGLEEKVCRVGLTLAVFPGGFVGLKCVFPSRRDPSAQLASHSAQSLRPKSKIIPST